MLGQFAWFYKLGDSCIYVMTLKQHDEINKGSGTYVRCLNNKWSFKQRCLIIVMKERYCLSDILICTCVYIVVVWKVIHVILVILLILVLIVILALTIIIK